MGFDYHFAGGNLAISFEQVPAIVAVAPDLLSQHSLTEENLLTEVKDRRASLKEQRLIERYPAFYASYTPEVERAIALLDLIAHQNEWSVGWGALSDSQGDTMYPQQYGIMVYFDTMNSGTTEEWLDKIAPFLVEGSWVQIIDDNYHLYRLYARNGQIVQVFPTWEG